MANYLIQALQMCVYVFVIIDARFLSYMTPTDASIIKTRATKNTIKRTQHQTFFLSFFSKIISLKKLLNIFSS